MAKRGAYCVEHEAQQRARFDAQRGSSTERGYNSRWQKARATYLRSHPLCRRCSDHGLVVEATVVDHIIPHEGDQQLFWDTDNWQALCKPCHDGWKQAQEAAGRKLYRKPRQGGGG